MKLWIGLIAALVIAQHAIAVEAEQPQDPGREQPAREASDSEAMAQARANQSRVKVPPAYKSGPGQAFPEGAQAAGEFGKVTLVGIIGVDGRFSELSVLESSRSERLDAAAIERAAAMVFAPAKDENGEAMPVRAVTPVQFSNANTPGKGGGVLRYRCDQFVRDYDWWLKTWPADKHSEFYGLVRGFALLARVSARQPVDGEDDFGLRWKKAIEDCRAAPDKLFVDIFQPEGKAMKEMSNR